MHDPTRHELSELSDAELDAVAAGQTTSANLMDTNKLTQTLAADATSNGGTAVAIATQIATAINVGLAIVLPRPVLMQV